jgi:hypothetical protein
MKVKYTSNLPFGYLGMNPRAAKELGLSCPRDTYLILDSLSAFQKKQILKHERTEYALMGKGLDYDEAHERASRIASYNARVIA